MFSFNKGLARVLVMLLLLQHAALAPLSAAASEDYESQSSAHCESMPEGDIHVDDNQQHEQADCIDAGCNDCVGCSVCLPLAFGADAVGPEQPIVLLSHKQIADPGPDFLYRPPILS